MQKQQGLLLPIEAKYKGLDADKHVIDAVYFGKSIEGTAKLYNQSIYLFENGVLPGPKSKYRFKMYTSCPEKGSVYLGFHSLMAVSELAVYPEHWGKLASWLVPTFVKFTWQRLLNKPTSIDQMFKFLQEESQRNREFTKEIAQMTIGAVLEDKALLAETIANLAKSNKGTAKLIVEPVGRTCATLTHSLNGSETFSIDEADAAVIRSKDDLEITKLENYKCRIEGVNKVNGSCWIRLPDFERPVVGKITDPQLSYTGNVYTNALDQSLEVIIQAKALLKDGEIQKLFISDAKR